MKKTSIIIAAIIMIAGFTSSLMAQNTVHTAAAAKIVSALTVSNDETIGVGLHFGTMTRPTAQTTVLVTALGGRSDGGSITLLPQEPSFHVAHYSVSADGPATYLITLPTSDVTIRNTANNTMTVNTFTCNKPSNIGTLNNSGVDSFTVGATLNLYPNQESGVYSGTYDVTVAYN